MGKTNSHNNKPPKPKLKKQNPVANKRQPKLKVFDIASHAPQYLNSTSYLQQKETLRKQMEQLIIRPRRFETGSRPQETDHEESRADEGETQIRLLYSQVAGSIKHDNDGD